MQTSRRSLRHNFPNSDSVFSLFQKVTIYANGRYWGSYSSMGQKPAIDLSSSMGWAEKAHLCASPKATFSCRDGSGDLGFAFFAHTPTWLIVFFFLFFLFLFLTFLLSSSRPSFSISSLFDLMSFLRPHFALLHLGQDRYWQDRRRIWGRKAMFMICTYTRSLLHTFSRVHISATLAIVL